MQHGALSDDEWTILLELELAGPIERQAGYKVVLLR
jgi:hypothetical protein